MFYFKCFSFLSWKSTLTRKTRFSHPRLPKPILNKLVGFSMTNQKTKFTSIPFLKVYQSLQSTFASLSSIPTVSQVGSYCPFPIKLSGAIEQERGGDMNRLHSRSTAQTDILTLNPMCSFRMHSS